MNERERCLKREISKEMVRKKRERWERGVKEKCLKRGKERKRERSMKGGLNQKEQEFQEWNLCRLL